MDATSVPRSTPRWLLILFAAMPLPLYAFCLLGAVLYIFLYWISEEPEASFVIIPFLLGVLYAIMLQVNVVVSAFRREAPLVRVGRRVALLHIRIFFCLTFAAWLPVVMLGVLVIKVVISSALGLFHPLVWIHVGLIALTIAASAILLRGSWKAVRSFAPPPGQKSGRQPNTITPVNQVPNDPPPRHKLHRVAP